MRKSLIIFTFFLSCIVNAQTYKLYKTDNIHNQLKLNTKTGEVNQIQDDGQTFLVCIPTTPNNEKVDRYALFKTENIWTFILLDTFTGLLWQCQYSVQGDEYRSSWIINILELSTTETSKFTIQAMTSMYQFYLINQESGEMWQFQWSTQGDDYRWIKKL
ncbi:MAG: hypothetical protein Q8T08_19270 [Ignavibacteria bacterium]|nr:hypothetical protein [Ignavibacteria bacterium]